MEVSSVYSSNEISSLAKCHCISSRHLQELNHIFKHSVKIMRWLIFQLSIFLVPVINAFVIIIQHQEVFQPQFFRNPPTFIASINDCPVVVEIIHRICPVICCLLIKYNHSVCPEVLFIFFCLLVLIIYDEIYLTGISCLFNCRNRNHIIGSPMCQYENCEIIPHRLRPP